MAAIVLNPGGVFFGAGATELTTVLGSCVGITVWHPRKRIGGMCHYLHAEPGGALARQVPGRHAEGAIGLLLKEIDRSGSRPDEFEVKLFGGANSLPQDTSVRVTGHGQRNIDKGRELLRRHGFRLQVEHVAGCGYRKLRFDLQDGRVDLTFHAYREASSPPSVRTLAL